MEKYLKPVVLTIIYVFSFVLSAVLGTLLVYVFNGDSIEPGSESGIVGKDAAKFISDYVVYMQLMSGIIAVFFAWCMRMVDFRKAYDIKSIDWKNAWKAIVGMMYFMYFVNVFFTMLKPEDDTDLAYAISILTHTKVGLIAFVILMPVFIELVFRESIMRWMLNNGASKLRTLLFASFCYSMMGVNSPISMPRHFILALIPGIIYIKRCNVVLTTITQILMYSAAIIIFVVYAEDQHHEPVTFLSSFIKFCYLVPFAYPCYRIMRSYYTDEPVMPPALWFKVKRVIVRAKLS